MSSRAKQLMGGILIASAVLIATSIEASAHTGNIVAHENCDTWSVVVSLDHNTTADRSVSVLTTIPGTTGFTGHHYNTSYGQIWSANGNAPASGTVTLKIDAGTNQEFTTSKSITPAEDCIPPTTTTTTEEPTSTTTVPATTSTSSTTTMPTTSSTLPSSTTSIPTQSSSTSSTSTSQPKIVLGPPITAIQTPPDALPRTGSTTLPLAVGGFASALLGAAFIAFARNRKAAR